jgi:pilus assembly protein CpaC
MNTLTNASGRRPRGVGPLAALAVPALILTSTLHVVAAEWAISPPARPAPPAAQKAGTGSGGARSADGRAAKPPGAQKSVQPRVEPPRPPAGGASDPPPLAVQLAAQPGEPIQELNLQPKQAQILRFRRIDQVAIVDPNVADVVLVGPDTMVVNAKNIGETLMFINHPGGRTVFRVVVASPPTPDLQRVASQIQAAIGKPGITARAVGRSILVEGQAADEADLRRAEAILKAFGVEAQNLITVAPPPVGPAPPSAAETAARALREALGLPDITIRVVGPNAIAIEGRVRSQAEAERVRALVKSIAAGVELVDLLVVPAPEPPTKRQVLIRTRVIEIRRNRTKDLGVRFGPLNADGSAILDPSFLFGQVLTPNTPPGVNIGPFEGVFGGGNFKRKFLLGAQIDALMKQGAARVLAEPNLVVLEGSAGNILIGGEFPYPAPQAAGASTVVTVQFKEFGIKLRVEPSLITEDEVTLKVEPEVSTVSTLVRIADTEVPSLSTRKASTSVRVQDGQSLAIGGLLQDEYTRSINGVEGVSRIPVLGELFKSRSFQRDLTELVILLTPEILGPGQAPSTPVPPTEIQRPGSPRMLRIR